MSDSIGWDALPVPVRDAVESRTGTVTAATLGPEGWSTDTRLFLDTADGRVFMKGTGPDASRRERMALALGADLAPHVTALSPRLLFRVQSGGWDVTGWPALPGRTADFAPGSADIPLVIGLLRALAEIPAPDVPGMPSASEDWGEPDLGGNMLVHTDPHPGNLLISDGRARLIDWGWAIRGAAWLTGARLMPHLIGAGWKPGDAEELLVGISAWAEAPAEAVTRYALANARSFRQAYWQRRGNQHRQRWMDITRRWAEHRAAGAAGDDDLDPFPADAWPFEAVAGRLAKRIRRGEFAAASRLPRQRDLARHYGVSAATVAHALRELEKRGLVTRRRGDGTYLA
jgi:DNA-binding transcriptional ArsR family regulator